MTASTRRRRVWAWLGLALLTLAWQVVAAAPASAHAALVGSNPSPDEVLPSAPTTVTLVFDEPVSPVDASFVLYDSGGRVQRAGTDVVLRVRAVDGSVVTDLPHALADGSYLLGWRVVSADGHPIGGALRFAVVEPSAEPPNAPVTSADGFSGPVLPAVVSLQVLGYAGLLGAAGLGIVTTLVLRTVAPKRLRRRVMVGFAVVGATAVVLLAGADVVHEQALPLGRVLGADVWRTAASGAAGLAAGLGVLGALLLVLGAFRGGASGRALTVLGALAAVATVLPSGHTRTYGPGPLMLALDAVHAAAAAVWLGGVVALGVHLRQTRQVRADPVSVSGDVVRFSGLAGLLVVLLGVSGVAMAVVVLGGPAALVRTGYGHALLVKLAVVAVIGLIAVFNRAWLVGAVSRRPHADAQWRRLRSAVRDEALLLVAVLAVTGLLTVQSPRSLASVAAGGASGAGSGSVGAAGLQRVALGYGSLQARLLPGRVGANTLAFRLRDADGAPLAAAGLPTVTAQLPGEALSGITGTVTAVDKLNGYEAALQLPLPGRWRFVVSVPTGVQDDVAAVTVTVTR